MVFQSAISTKSHVILRKLPNVLPLLELKHSQSERIPVSTVHIQGPPCYLLSPGRCPLEQHHTLHFRIH